ncbi:MAG: alpha-1,4-glucan--maltose-1-phosphate maltosyltransferase [Micrococcales bacterium]|nr:MAG: alpha-1,4-glucan--maltose-1-phosphate maltosyltransferase [Micrococcales bacterium]PIE27548.1 MAG: alpha-1,4-glucan--maltose-1-phosphate maltosyltransferase [Micrococcales bacterium]
MPILDVGPTVDDGRWPAKCVVAESVPVSATVFREGHDLVGATAVLIDPDGAEHSRARMHDISPGNDRWQADVVPDRMGLWHFRVEAWDDPYGTWAHDAPIKVQADVDTDVMIAMGIELLSAAAAERDGHEQEVLNRAVEGLRDESRPAMDRVSAGLADEVRAMLEANPIRRHVTASEEYPLRVERELALFGAWYEIFPRSVGSWYDEEQDRWVGGTLRQAVDALPRIAHMGFDVVYLTPVHPIGTTNRKGRNNSLQAQPSDPGSPYAIGSADGGHDAIAPQLGTFEDFDDFVTQAKQHGLEVALDIALQCSPDHPWVSEHPEWFTSRPDGSIAFAENPPKKYQDIYPLNFDNDPEGIYREVLRIILLWVEHGVTLFRVDNPHTKPVEFWEWLIAEVNRDHPEVIFLAEAFTTPAMMRTLAKVGFQQSYTYFTWRTTKRELTDYVVELTTGKEIINADGKSGTADYMRPSFWPTTHDILTPQMWYGGPAIFAIRAVLAATMSPTWGIYTGYELVENVARPGAQEQIDNEKYEIKHRDFATPLAEGRSMQPLLTRLNQIRKEHVALQRLRGLVFHATDDPMVIAYSRWIPATVSPTGQENTILVVCSLDPLNSRETNVHVNLGAMGMRQGTTFTAVDQLNRAEYTWGEENFVRLHPGHPAHIMHIRRNIFDDLGG